MASAAMLRRRLEKLEQRDSAGVMTGIVEIPHGLSYAEEEQWLKDHGLDGPLDRTGYGVAIVPATCPDGEAWDAAVRRALEWGLGEMVTAGSADYTAKLDAWHTAIREDRARICRSCDKRFIKDTRVCPGCNGDTERVC